MKNPLKLDAYIAAYVRHRELRDVSDEVYWKSIERMGAQHAELLADGWTMAELDAAFGAYFGVDIDALRKKALL